MAAYGLAYNTHPNEPTSRAVAEALRLCPIGGIVPVQANVLAAAQHPPARFTGQGQELTSAFTAVEPPPNASEVTYEGRRAAELARIYRGADGVIDVHNNATNATTYGMCGPRSLPVVLDMAAALGITDIVLLDSRDAAWEGYEYYDACPNLLTVEGRDDNPAYTARWWHERLELLAAGAFRQPAFRFYRRLPDITWTQAERGGFSAVPWVPGFSEPLPAWIASQLRDGPGRVHALSWPGESRTGYAQPGLDYFGEAVVELEVPPGGLYAKAGPGSGYPVPPGRAGKARDARVPSSQAVGPPPGGGGSRRRSLNGS